MQYFYNSLISVAILYSYAAIGFILVKSKILKINDIGAVTKLLMYVSQPFLTLEAFVGVEYKPIYFKNMMAFFGLALLIQFVVIGGAYLISRKYHTNGKVRIANIAISFGNVGFFGIPLIKALLPEYPEAPIYAVFFLIAMNMIGWTLASTIISGNRKLMKIWKAFLNPAVFPVIIALPMFMNNVAWPNELEKPIHILGSMSVVLCMLIPGMRVASADIRGIFKSASNYIIVLGKQIIFPLFSLAIIYFMPLDPVVKKAFFILSCTPIASVVAAFAEMFDGDKESASNILLLGTLMSIFTIPLMMLFFNIPNFLN